MTEELKTLISSYERSRVLRLGVAYLETPPEQRQSLARETGESMPQLSKYATKARLYFPHTAPTVGRRLKEGWADEEDNYLMAHYQTAQFQEVERQLPARTKQAIYKRASFLGITRDK